MTQQQGVMTDEAPLGKNQRGTRDGNADTDVPTGKIQYSNPLAEPSTIREAPKPDTPIEASTFTQPERAEASGSSGMEESLQEPILSMQERYNRQTSYFNNPYHSQLRRLEALKSQAQSPYASTRKLEQQPQKEQEAFQKLAHESLESYFDSPRVPLASSPPSLRLNENLQICLLALASRYPSHILDINEELLGPQSLGAEGWRASDIIELFQSTAPQMLQARACLEVNAERIGIYLLESSFEMRAFWVHCGECGQKMPVPPYRGNMTARREKQRGRDG